MEDATDYMLDPKCFRYIDRLWGPHTVDRFVSIKTKQLDRYYSRYCNPGCEARNAFTVSWFTVSWITTEFFHLPCLSKGSETYVCWS